MRVVSVYELNNYIKSRFEEDANLMSVCVKGEISNFKHHYSGHMYMSLKDESGAIRAVMFRQSASRLSFLPKDGMSVMAFGRVSVYERDGSYQLYIETMVPDGIGQKYAAYEQLKQTLESKGYFDETRKKAIPQFPNAVGVVTSATGAAIRDIINVISRRCPSVDIKIYPALVQGDGAGASVTKGIELFNRMANVDVLIVGRGGGSIEDLWAFNEPVVAEAIYNSQIPVVSAVGHETDFTIADFVADMRAPTPSAAAELVTPSFLQLRIEINTMKRRLSNSLGDCINLCESRLKAIVKSRVFANPLMAFEPKLRHFDEMCERLVGAYQNSLTSNESRLKENTYKLMSLSPIRVFDRGYSVASVDSKIIKSTSDVQNGDGISIRLKDGSIDCTVTNIRGDIDGN